MIAERIPLAREGYPFILFTAWSTSVTALLGWPWATLGLLLATFFITWFFRDPCRVIPAEPEAIVSPADGKIILVDRLTENRYLHQEAQRISIFMNIFNVHVNRLPHAGVVRRVLFQPGRFYSADHEKAVLHNEQCCLLIETAQGWQYGVVQVAGLIARRIVCRAEPGDRLRTGERYGLIRFGSRVDLYLPPDVDVMVRVGQKVTAGESLLARVKTR